MMVNGVPLFNSSGTQVSVKCGHGRHFSPASDALDEVDNACWALPRNENSSYSVIRVLMVCGTFIIAWRGEETHRADA